MNTDKPRSGSAAPRGPAVPPLLTAGVAAVFTAAWVVLLVNGARQADLDHILGPRDGLVRVSDARPGSPFRRGDRVLRVDGLEVGRELDLRGAVKRTRYGRSRSFQLTVERGETVLTVRVERRPLMTRADAVLGTLIFLVHLGLGVALAAARTADSAPRTLLFLLPMLGLLQGGTVLHGWAFFGYPVDGLSLLARLLFQSAQRCWPGLALVFLVSYPERMTLRRGVLPAAVAVLSGLPLAWLLLGRLYFDPRGLVAPSFLGAVELIADHGEILVIALFAARFLHCARTAREDTVRSKARGFLLPTALYALFVLAFYKLPGLFGGPPLLPDPDEVLVSLLSVLVPAAMAVTVSRRRLFDIDRLLRRSVAYFLVTTALVAAFLAVVPVATALALRLVPDARVVGPTAASLLAILGLLALEPLRKRAQALIDRTFYRDREDPARLMTAILESTAETGRLHERVREVLGKVDSAFHPVAQVLWVLDHASRGVVRWDVPEAWGVETTPVHAGAPPETAIEGGLRDVQLDAGSLARHVRGLPQGSGPAHTSSVTAAVDDGSLAERLEAGGAAVSLPLRSGAGEPLGLWVLGERKSEQPYSEAERSVLAAVARALAFVLERERLALEVDSGRRREGRMLAALARTGQGLFAECPACGRCYDEPTSCPHDGKKAEMSQAFPRHLGQRYLLERRLGAGGMGVVYRARDSVLTRDVAVKLVKESRLEDPSALRRLAQEARLAARLSHPNAVAVYDFGELPGTGAYIVMELLEGRTLSQEVAMRKRLPFDEGQALVSQMLLALSAAHGLGLVHRDVKPANVFLCSPPPGERPILKLLDFGLAQALRAEDLPKESRLTGSGDVLGTPGYIAPEVMAGQAATPASDIWSAAATAYEIFAGQLPFQGRSIVEMFDLARQGIAVPLLAVAPDVPYSYSVLLHEALSPEPARRPASAARLREELQRAR